MRHSIWALAVVATPALAEPVCELPSGRAVAVMDQAKEAFLKGDFEGFSDISTQVMRGNREQLAAPIAQLSELFPNGFDSCQTVIQRHDVGGTVQDVTTFNFKGGDFPMSLYLMAMPIRGEMKIVQLNFDTGLAKVLSELR